MELCDNTKLVVTFDIDGTLVRSHGGETGNAGHWRAFHDGLEAGFGFRPERRGSPDLPHHGSTDLLVLALIAEHAGYTVTDEAIERGKLAMIRHAEQYPDTFGEGLDLLPGVPGLLSVLSSTAGVHAGLVTGNLQPIAWAKMHSLGIGEYFGPPTHRFGGFGSDGTDRHALCQRAHLELRPAPSAAHWHVGDAPADITAALSTPGCKALGVTTGVFSREQLLDAAERSGVPDWAERTVILDGLSNTTRVCEVFGLQG